MKRIISCFLCALLAVGICVSAYASNSTVEDSTTVPNADNKMATINMLLQEQVLISEHVHEVQGRAADAPSDRVNTINDKLLGEKESALSDEHVTAFAVHTHSWTLYTTDSWTDSCSLHNIKGTWKVKYYLCGGCDLMKGVGTFTDSKGCNDTYTAYA